MHSSVQKFPFTFHVYGPLSDFVRLKLFNAFDELVADGYGRVRAVLPKGLYKLRIELNEHVEHRIYRLDKDKTDSWRAAGTYSSIPDSQLLSSHEYYSTPAQEFSRRPTVSTENRHQKKSSLFVFFRRAGRDSVPASEEKASLGLGFCLLDAQRDRIYTFDNWNIQEDRESGWLAFHAPLPRGIYYLQYHGTDAREIPLYVFPEWQTQLFLTFGQGPLFRTMRILLARPHLGFNREERKNLEIDALIQKMQNGIHYVPERLVNMVASGKWEDPMLGIIVCYTYFLSSAQKHNDLFDLILKNLESSILQDSEAPDIKALKVLAGAHRGAQVRVSPLDSPCMVLQGMKMFMQNAWGPTSIIVADSIAERSIPSLRFDTFWTSYTPVESPATDENSIGLEYAQPTGTRQREDLDSVGNSPYRKSQPHELGLDRWVTATLFSHLLANGGNPLSVHQMAAQWKLTSRIIKAHLQYMATHPEEMENMAVSILGIPTQEARGLVKEIKARAESAMRGS